ncbi:FUSC family protein [Kitasatospora sp. NPDC059571]|uniref:FUSC family protein n=1 Tax=Kitasatospora sp. NPDC059571 TaxID=3346871 RepID=UPI00367938AD
MSIAVPAPRLPLAAPLRLGRPSDIWYKPALSVVVAAAVPDAALLAAGRLDLATATTAGSLCALYGHNLPYAARARTVARLVLGMLAGYGLAMAAAALTGSVVVLVAVGAALAAVQKALCDAGRIGPPGHVILAFVSSAALFAPLPADRIPGRLGLAAAAGVLAWLVCLAPALVRSDGPERHAVARALDAAARYAAEPGGPHRDRLRAAAASAVHAAWQTLAAAGSRSPHSRSPHSRSPRSRTPRSRAADPRALAVLLGIAETALAGTPAADAEGAGRPDRLRARARALRAGGPVPLPGPGTAALRTADDHLAAAHATAAAGRPSPARLLGPGSPLLPIVARTFLGCALAGWTAAALGIGRPAWALVTAASIYQVNGTLTWHRALQRVVGNLLGVLVFAAVVPVARLGAVPLVLCCLAGNFGAEALIGRNYWLGSVCVTPMALLITEFGRVEPAGELVADRVLDTLAGAALGLLAALLVTNRRAGHRVSATLAHAADARARTEGLLAHPAPDPAALAGARRRLTGALVDLRAAADTAAGEWRTRTVPPAEIAAEELAGHRTLAATVRRQASPGPQPALG